MTWKCFAVGAAALAAVGAVRGEGLTLATGFDYTSGKYGTPDKTQILYVPLIAKYDVDAWALKLTVPYIRITGPGNVVGAGADRITLPGPAGPRRTESGLGDVVASAFYSVLSERRASFGLDLGAKVKFGTADETKSLGTGQTDYSLQADVYKPVGQLNLFASLGHRWYGDPPGIDLRNVFYWAVGGGYRLSADTSAGLAYDHRPAIIAGGGEISELTAFLTRRLAQQWKLQPYVVLGFGRASPDWGAGAQIAYSY